MTLAALDSLQGTPSQVVVSCSLLITRDEVCVNKIQLSRHEFFSTFTFENTFHLEGRNFRKCMCNIMESFIMLFCIY